MSVTYNKQKLGTQMIKTMHRSVKVTGAEDASILAGNAIVLAAFTTASTATTAFKIGATAVDTPDIGGLVALTGAPQDILIFPQPVSAASPLYITFDGAGTADITVVYIDYPSESYTTFTG